MYRCYIYFNALNVTDSFTSFTPSRNLDEDRVSVAEDGGGCAGVRTPRKKKSL